MLSDKTRYPFCFVCLFVCLVLTFFPTYLFTFAFLSPRYHSSICCIAISCLFSSLSKKLPAYTAPHLKSPLQLLVAFKMPRSRFHLSETFTSITPPSFIDDGHSIVRRMPRTSRATDKPPEPTAISELDCRTHTLASSSTYTGSFIDDGADMLVPSKSGPGFGAVDRRFYRKGKKSREEGEWTAEMENAVSGDIRKSLAKIRRHAVVDVDAEEKQRREEQKKHDAETKYVKIPKVPKWPTFVIQCENGRVIVVDSDGEYDSGPPEQKVEWEKAQRRDQERAERKEEERKRQAEERARKEKSVKPGVEEAVGNKRRSRASRTSKHRHQDHTVRSSRSSKNTTSMSDAISELTITGVSPTTNFFATGTHAGWSPVPSFKTPIYNPSTSPVQHLPGAFPSPELSPMQRAPSAMKSLPALTSATRSKGSWGGERAWGKTAAALELPRSGYSSGYPNATSSAPSAARTEDSREKVKRWQMDMDIKSSRASSKRGSVRSHSRAGSNTSWKRDVDAFNANILSRPPPPMSQSSTESVVGWKMDAEEQRAQRDESPHRASAWGASKPDAMLYSWRRGVEELSTYSTNGTDMSTSRAPPEEGTKDSWKEDQKAWHYDEDNRSVKSQSTYRAPGVEDATSTPEEMREELIGWGIESNGNESEKTREEENQADGEGARGSKAGSVKWNEQESKVGWNKNGFDEDDDAWFNAEVGGIRYREAEWRRTGSWRDV